MPVGSLGCSSLKCGDGVVARRTDPVDDSSHPVDAQRLVRAGTEDDSVEVPVLRMQVDLSVHLGDVCSQPDLPEAKTYQDLEYLLLCTRPDEKRVI